MGKTISDLAYQAATQNDVDAVKNYLCKLGIRKDPNIFKNAFSNFKRLGKTKNREEIWNEGYLLQSLFSSFMQNKNFKFCSYLLESDELHVNVKLDSSIFGTCLESGNSEFIQYAIDRVKASGDLSVITRALNFVTEVQSNEEVLKILLMDEVYQELINQFSADPVSFQFYLLINSCGCNNEEIVKFILNHDLWFQLVNKKTYDESLYFSCINNHVQMIDFLLYDKSVPQKATDGEELRQMLRISARYGCMDVLSYLIFNANVPKPERFDMFFDSMIIAHHVSSFKSHDEIDDYNKSVRVIKDMFEKRELKESLESNLGINLTSIRPRRKI